MRKILLTFISILILASCSAPKYAYHFDHYDYNAGKRKQITGAEPEKEGVPIVDEEQSHLKIDLETMVASTSEEVIVLSEMQPKIVEEVDIADKKQYADMTKAEKKEVRREFRKDLKEYKEAKKGGDEVRAEQAKEKLTGYTRIGVILIVAGLVLAILSLGSVINSIGGLMVLAGIIFILVDIL